MSFIKMLLMTGGVLALGLTASGTARAATCATDSECPQGFACVVSGYVSSGPAPACDSKTACPTDAPATTTEIKACQPKACATDADCGGGTFCHEETSTACSGGSATRPCKEGDPSCVTPPPSEPVCTTTTSRHCAFHWQFPCQADADCGDGFTCRPSVVTSCSSGGGGVASSGGISGSTGQGGTAAGNSSGSDTPTTGSLPAPPDQCTTTTSYPGSCQPKATSCLVDSDCPQTWTCSSGPPTRGTGTPVAVDVGGSGGATGGATGGSTAEASDPAPTIVPVVKACISPFGYGSYGGARATDGASTGTGGTTGGTASGPNKGEASNPTTPPSGSGGSGGSLGAETPTGHATGDNVAGGGCSVAASGGSAALSSVGLLGVLALRLRRRRR